VHDLNSSGEILRIAVLQSQPNETSQFLESNV
jgi:hypothetical protein